MSEVVKISLGLLPSAAWLIFFLGEDRGRPEPKQLIFFAFAAGALSTLVVLQIQIFLQPFLSVLPGGITGPWAVSWLALVEEIMKFLAVYLLVHKRKEFDEPIDPMIYMIVASLGFAAVENIASIFKSTSGLELILLRFIGATLLHGLTTGTVGYWWAQGIMRRRQWLFIGLGLAIATVIHSIFNYMIIEIGPGISVTLFLLTVGFFILYDFERVKYIDYIKPQKA